MAQECQQPLGLLQRWEVQNSLAGSYEALMESNVWSRAQYAVIIMLSAAVYCWAIGTAARPGLPRLLVCIPAMLAIHGTPLLFYHHLEPFATITATFLGCRLTCGKVLAFIMGRGVLVLPLTLPQFVAVMLAPFMPAQLVASRLSFYKAAEQDSATAQAMPAHSTVRDTRQPSSESSAHGGMLWQQVTPTQRYSIDLSRHSIDSTRSRNRRWKMGRSSSPQQASATAAGKNPGHAMAATSSNRSKMDTTADSTAWQSINDNKSSSLGGTERLLRLANVVLNVAVVLAFGVYTCSSKARMVSASVSISGLWVMWRAMECLMRAASTPARTLLGMTLAPHFRNPFASSSLTDFWARRWNITQGLVLRFFVYEPIVQARLVSDTPTPGQVAAVAGAGKDDAGKQLNKLADTAGSTRQDSSVGSSQVEDKRAKLPDTAQHKDCAAGDDIAPTAKLSRRQLAAVPVLAAPSKTIAPRWRRQVAAAATFIVSGLEHELFMAYITHSWGWRWFVFFSLQGLLLAIESAVKRKCAKLGLQLHPFAASLAVLLVLGVTADEFFWPVLVQPKLVQPLQAALPEQVKELAARLHSLTHTHFQRT